MMIKYLWNSYLSDIIRVTCFGLYDCTIFVVVDFKLNGCVYIFADVEITVRP